MCKQIANKPRQRRHFRGLTHFLAVVCLLPATVALTPTVSAQDSGVYLSYFGTPGLLDMPSAAQMGDGTLGFTVAGAGTTRRNTLTFQISPRLSGSFRYAIISGFDPTNDRFDRSFDLTYLVRQESDWGPAVAVGLRDFAGTGIYSSEFLAATKSFGSQFRATVGLGWGRLAQRDGFDNPLSGLSGYFDNRPRAAAGGISTTGQLDFGSWFRGDAAVFGGLEWLPNDRMRVVLEYSTDQYNIEAKRGLIDQQSPLNIGVNYRFRNGVDLGVYYMYGTDVGVSLSYVLDPVNPPSAGGIESAPPALLPRDRAAALSWNLGGERPQGSALEALSSGLAAEGLVLNGVEQSGSVVTVYLGNPTYAAGAQAIGRAARVLANSAPADVTAFRIVPVAGGIPLSQVTVQRSDLEELEHALEGSWQSYSRATIADAAGLAGPFGAPLNMSPLSFAITPYLSPSLFDPDNPIRADAGVEVSASYAVTPQLVFSGAIRQPILGNLDTAVRLSDSILPHVRSDFALYDKASDLELSYLTADYFFRPGPDLYGRVTAGYLEPMFAGVSTEVLWKPVTGPLALGVEVNYAVQRGFARDFTLQDYDVVTGHASAYYDFGRGYHGQLDLGRYLAGDWGGTVTLDRRFSNGVSVGAFFTLTDVSFDDFGEGSFDKGINLTIPISWLSGQPSRTDFATTIRPLLRDGGARLDVANRLYDLTSDYHDPALQDRWGRFWR